MTRASWQKVFATWFEKVESEQSHSIGSSYRIRGNKKIVIWLTAKRLAYTEAYSPIIGDSITDTDERLIVNMSQSNHAYIDWSSIQAIVTK